MKPCENNKRLLALMAAGVPDGTNAERLRQHMESCSGCRRYWESMCVLSERLVNISELPQAKPSEDFHATLAARIATQEQRRPGLE
jgi:predicted anti-sigma-YlaC factor YlaD